MTAPVRVGVIGTGFGARVVAPTFASTEGCEVVDVVSARDDEAIVSLCRRADLDLVSVHSPPFLHADHVRRALDAGRAVLCDKPFARDCVEAASLLGDAEAAGVIHLVNFEFRFDPSRRHVRELLATGAAGRPEHVQWTHLSSGSRVPLRPFGWLFDREQGGGWIGAWASHAVDTLRFLLGAELDVVASVPRTAVPRRPDRDGVLRPCTAEDGLAAALRSTDGATIAIDSSFAAPATLPPRLVIVGDDGVIENVADAKVALHRADGTRDTTTFERAAGDRHGGPMARWAEVVRDAVRAGIAPPDAATFADGLACDRVLDALRRPAIV
ncbi:MAG TPA: Gfo/Idh/MocA family oxidoreductase [Acidimicrobiia bacterium]|jgi:predicted dehydrogenase